MQIIRSIEQFKFPGAVLTVGTFDGLHPGHKKILEILVNEAQKEETAAVVFTLRPHPRKILFPEQKDLAMLNTRKEKIDLLNAAGIQVMIEHPFDKAFSKLSSCEFIEEILYKRLKIKKLIIGYDHRFGKDRQGDPEVLKKCASPFGIEVFKVDAYKIEGEEVSSTKIRKALEQGRIEYANNLLGYRYTFEGHVISGNKIGRTLGFPTANIEPADPEKLIPHKGVYDVELIISGNCYRGMLNIGTRPTISNQIHSVLEVHIFDFNRNIYHENVTILFNRFIREEKKFLNTEDLIEQLEIDKKIILQKQ